MSALGRLVPPPGLTRRLAFQSVLLKTGDGVFNTGSAVFFTQVVGLSIIQVGVGLSIAGVLSGVAAIPTGRLADRIGPKRAWALGAALCAAAFAAWPFIDGFAAYVVMVTLYSIVENTAEAGRQAYVLDVVPPAERIPTQAYIYSAMNVGSTIGALLGGVALAFDDTTVLRWLPIATVALFGLDALFVTRLPAAPRDLRSREETKVRPEGPPALANRGYLALQFCMGSLWTNQTLLSVLIPLWLVQETDSPHWLLAWLFGTNTVLCIVLPQLTSAGVRTLEDALRRVRWSAAFFMASCLITMVTHSTTGLVTALLVWLGHLTVTGAELATGSAGWMFQARLQDPRRRAEYGSVGGLLSQLGGRFAPALYTWLAMEWRHVGWMVIGLMVVAAAAGAHPAVRRAERFAEEYFPDETMVANLS
ncbi:MFS transporter [Nocardioides sp. BP30]|uniref:MFS transporter n=1 Tax=Nocardioides sp. BP30 TaxID=3036374 RepID=UPI00246932C8|nr:MFS transporter [Nocardioides sp. BP30]WGL52933.1 MFS transporter [Nocardioides sp. BP30]